MTSDPRWTDETVYLLVRAQNDLRAEKGDEWNFYDGAQRFLAALADAGRLMPPGGETREEWGYQVAGHADPWGHTRFRHRAEERLSAFLGQVPSGDAHLVRRTVHVGPWQPAEASEEDR